MAVLEVQTTENSMQSIISLLDEKVKNIDHTAYSGKYKNGYVDGVKDAIEVLEKKYVSLLYVGGIYCVINYIDNDRERPIIEDMRLIRIRVSGNRTTYSFVKDVDNVFFSMMKPDIRIGSATDLYNRVFLTRESAERYLQRGKTRRIQHEANNCED